MSALFSSQSNLAKAVVVTIFSAQAFLIWYKIFKNKKSKGQISEGGEKLNENFCKVLFFPDKQIPCFNYLLTAQELAEAVLIKHRLGAKVCVISDTEYMNMSGSKIQSFMAEGIAVRHDRSSYLMHHKFVVVDEEIIITGSFNWTHAAVIGNFENVVATNNGDVVRPYVVEFNRLWELFDAESKPQGDVDIGEKLLGKSEKYYVERKE